MRSLKILPLFIVTCSLKIGLAVLAWYVQSMLILGSIIPLSLMILYIFIGYRYRESVVSDEKFADSCYYLGFIFTIVSIILCLADLPNIGSEIYIIAARFGAAMISTVLGLFVRVCLVSFRPTLEDAVRNMEDHSVEASRRLIDSYQRSFDELEHFRGEVAAAAKETVLGVTREVQSITEQTAKRMDEFFVEVSTRNTQAMAEIVQDVKTTTLDLKKAVEAFTKAAMGSVNKVDKTVDTFATGVVEKLDSIDFPQDLFSKKLDTAINALNGSTDALTQGVTAISGQVLDAARLVEKSITKINLKTDSITNTLEVAEQIAAQQKALLEIIEDRNEGMIESLRAQQEQIVNALEHQRQATAEGASRQLDVLTEISGTFLEIGNTMKAVNENVALSTDLSAEIKGGIVSSAHEEARAQLAIQENLATLEQAIKANLDNTADLSADRKSLIDSQEAYQARLSETLNQIDRAASASTETLLAAQAVLTATPPSSAQIEPPIHRVEPATKDLEDNSNSKLPDQTKGSWFGRKEAP